VSSWVIAVIVSPSFVAQANKPEVSSAGSTSVPFGTALSREHGAVLPVLKNGDSVRVVAFARSRTWRDRAHSLQPNIVGGKLDRP
jgi:hypothetical protein